MNLTVWREFLLLIILNLMLLRDGVELGMHNASNHRKQKMLHV